jgi:hypothetical protein
MDSKFGMRFNNRRQVKDVEMLSDLVSKFGRHKIYIAPFSANIFANYENVTICEDPISTCEENSLCFIEEVNLIHDLNAFDKVVIYTWGLNYPADEYFEYDLNSLGFKKISKDKIKTLIHEKIICEVYKNTCK